MAKRKHATGPGEFDERAFERAFLAADYPECQYLGRLAKHDEAVLLDAKVAWREQRYVDMIQPLSALKPKNSQAAIERDVLLGAAYGSTKDYSTARLRLDRVLQKAPEKSRLHADALYHKALVAWMEHEHRESEAIVSSLFLGASPNDRARAHILLSWIAVRRRDVGRQVDELTKALDALDQTQEPDLYYRAKALMTLALLCRELPLRDATERVRETVAQMKWSAGTRLQQFQTARFLGWIDALQGNELAAFRGFRNATSLAPSEHWRVLCLTDRAYLARNTGERSFADDLLGEAHELASRLSWHETTGEERSALFVLAALFADTNPALAEQYLAQFRSLNTSVLPGISYTTDPRTRAFAAYSSGMALLGLGEKEEAVAMLSDAWETFNAFGYGWRAALCALALSKATGDATWLIDARRQIAPWPNNWIAREIAAASETSTHNRLPSKAQRRVLDLLLEGKSNAAIAKVLGRSPYTVRNHIAQLFRTYNVKNRTQLAGLFRSSRAS